MKSKNRKTSVPNRPLIKLTDQMNSKRSDKLICTIHGKM